VALVVLMPSIRIPVPVKTEIQKQPEFRRERMSYNSTTLLLIEEALQQRRAKLKKGPKLRG